VVGEVGLAHGLAGVADLLERGGLGGVVLVARGPPDVRTAAAGRRRGACPARADRPAAVPAPRARPARPGRRVEAPALSSREIDVLAHTGLGLRNGETAELLGLSAETVKSYLRSAMTKLDAHSRQEAVRRSRELGVLP
jgi:DNA-binding CsgD family transcriptional regulator